MKGNSTGRIFDLHINKFCKEKLHENYETIMDDPHFLQMIVAIGPNDPDFLALLQKYIPEVVPGTIMVTITVSRTDPDGIASIHGDHVEILASEFFYQGSPLSPSICSMTQESLFQADDAAPLPDIFLIDVLKECIAQNTSSPIMYIEDYKTR